MNFNYWFIMIFFCLLNGLSIAQTKARNEPFVHKFVNHYGFEKFRQLKAPDLKKESPNGPHSIQQISLLNVILPDFQVNKNVGPNYQFNTKIAVNESGHCVAVWLDFRDGGSDIYAQLIDPKGNRIGNNIRINQAGRGTSDRYFIQIDMNQRGQFVVVWENNWGNSAVYARLFNPDGTPACDEIVVSSFADAANTCICEDGSFYVVHRFGVWNEYLRYVKFNTKGQLLFEGNFYEKEKDTDDLIITRSYEYGFSSDDKNILLVWEERKDDSRQLVFQKLSFNAAVMTEKRRLNFYEDTIASMDAYLSPAGDFIVVFLCRRNDIYGNYLAHFDSLGNLIGPVQYVLDTEVKQCMSPVIAGNKYGEFVVSWEDGRKGVNNYSPYIQLYNANAEPQGKNLSPTNLNTYDEIEGLALTDAGKVIFGYQARQPDLQLDIFYHQMDTKSFQFTQELLLNDDINSSDQFSPQIGVSDAGKISIAWVDRRNVRRDLYFKQFDEIGRTVTEETKVNDDYTESHKYDPDLVVNRNGNSIIVWADYRENFWNIYGQQFDASGKRKNRNFRISDQGIKSYKESTSLAVDDSGRIFVTWIDDRNGYQIFAQKLGPEGNRLKKDIQITNNPVSGFTKPDVAISESGTFLFTWNADNKLWAKVYNENGVPKDSALVISECSYVESPSVASDPDGNFWIAWIKNLSIYVMPLNTEGRQLKPEILVYDKAIYPSQITIGVDKNLNIAVCWMDELEEVEEYTDHQIFCQFLNSDGNKMGDLFIVNNDQEREEQYSPDIQVKNDIAYFAWTDGRAFGQGLDIYAKIIECSQNTIIRQAQSLAEMPFVSSNYPNPFNLGTTINYSVPHNGTIRLKIFNSNGQLVRDLLDEYKTNGVYSVVWDGKNNEKEIVTSGIYFYYLQMGDFATSKKMILLK